MANKYVLITGASSGIGREIAIHLSGEHNLILNGRDGERLNSTRSACRFPEKHVIWQYDLNDVAGISAALYDLLRSDSMGVSHFIHAAGMIRILPHKSADPELTLKYFNINVFSASQLITLLVRKTINSNHLRSVVFISSTASKFGARGFGLYGATKGALDSLMRSLAVELAPGIRVNSILPGGIRTGMTESIFNNKPLADSMLKEYPLGPGEASDIAHAVEFLISGKARWITGQQLIVDGGRTVNISR